MYNIPNLNLQKELNTALETLKRMTTEETADAFAKHIESVFTPYSVSSTVVQSLSILGPVLYLILTTYIASISADNAALIIIQKVLS